MTNFISFPLSYTKKGERYDVLLASGHTVHLSPTVYDTKLLASILEQTPVPSVNALKFEELIKYLVSLHLPLQCRLSVRAMPGPGDFSYCYDVAISGSPTS